MGAKAGELREVPGPETKAWVEREKKVSAQPVDEFRLVIKSGDGAYVYDADGNEYFHFGAPGTNLLGQGKILEENFLLTIKTALHAGIPMFTTTEWGACETIRAKERLVASVPLSGEGVCWGARGGGLAIESAIKAYRKERPERTHFLCFHGAFHGRPHGALSLIEKRKIERVRHYNLPYPIFQLRFPYLGHPYPEEIVDVCFESQIGLKNLTKISAIFVEFVQGEGGIRVIDPRGEKRIRDWCRAYDIRYTADEIQTGMGRTGSRWCYEQYGALPDMAAFGKALGAGAIDVNALVMRRDLAFQKPGQESSTYDMPPIVAATLMQSLNILETYKLSEAAKEKGILLNKLLRERLSGKKFVKDVRGLGLMQGVEFTQTAFRDQFMEEAKKRGLLLLDAGFSEDDDPEFVSGPVVRFMPPLTITEMELNHACDITLAAYNATLEC